MKLKPMTIVLALGLVIAPAVHAMDKPDLEGPIVKINMVKSVITVRNIGKDVQSKNKEKKVLVKQGMISNYRLGDYVQIRLMQDNYEAKQIEKQATPR